MTDTARRTLLTAIALAPVVGAMPAAAAHAAPAHTDLRELGIDDLLRLGATECGDPAFSALCADGLRLYEEELRAWALCREANERAHRMAPFPEALEIPQVLIRPDGQPDHWIDQWNPEGAAASTTLRFLARAQLRARLGRNPRSDELLAHETALRAQWDDWERANHEAEAAHRVPELRQAADAAADTWAAHFAALMEHRPRSALALRLKCCLRWAEGPSPSHSVWREIADDVEAALA